MIAQFPAGYTDNSCNIVAVDKLRDTYRRRNAGEIRVYTVRAISGKPARIRTGGGRRGAPSAAASGDSFARADRGRGSL